MSSKRHVFKALKKQRICTRVCAGYLLLLSSWIGFSTLFTRDKRADPVALEHSELSALTTDFQFFLLLFIFVVIGLAGLFLPKRKLNRLITHPKSRFGWPGQGDDRSKRDWQTDYPVISWLNTLAGTLILFYVIFGTIKALAARISAGESAFEIVLDAVLGFGVLVIIFYLASRLWRWFMRKFEWRAEK